MHASCFLARHQGYLQHCLLTSTILPRYVVIREVTWHIVASELKNPIWHSLEWQIGSFGSEATICAAQLAPLTSIYTSYSWIFYAHVVLPESLINKKAVCLQRRIDWGFRTLLCACRLNWARRTSSGWWDEWDDTALQTQDFKFEPWRSEAEHATSRSRRLPTIMKLYEWAGKKHFVSLKLECQSGGRARNPRLI